MATRFYFPATTDTAPPVSPAFAAAWEQTGQAVRLNLLRKTRLSVKSTIANSSAITIPITTTQDILCVQLVSELIPPQRLIGVMSLVIRAFVSTAGNNGNLAYSVRVINDDGTVRATLASDFATINNFQTSPAASRFAGDGITTIAITPTTTLPGDRLVVEIGAHVNAPSVGGSYTMSFGDSSATDLTLVDGTTSANNPWIEFSQNIWSSDLSNYQSFRDSGTAFVSDRIR